MFIENRIRKKDTKQIVVLRDFLIMRLEGLSKYQGLSERIIQFCHEPQGSVEKAVEFKKRMVFL